MYNIECCTQLFSNEKEKVKSTKLLVYGQSVMNIFFGDNILVKRFECLIWKEKQ